ncbi:type VI secretion system lipoprotein TssJ [Motiliproteus sp. MSK22-1]|uniref:type VI secretion system lipoprotein TssJ n=1 Tax=Motiliproteus sp. MSK22-1 TaxID=1897630 RepID=UPI0009755D64|nr:type VI secretion system lipoprotein TssJ [Motiliproteus sp. MSK22-1]OMH38683.1 type VI secretion system-associated lipoprotein [Motiliproteus sp. MSK22-1]
MKYLVLILFTSLLSLTGCSVRDVIDVVDFVNDTPTRLELQAKASEDINPAADGSAAPLVILIYELSAKSKFESSDFFSLYAEKPATLGDEMIARVEQNIMPGQELTINRELKPETKFIGLVAAFRDIDNASWRLIAPIEATEKNRIKINLDKNSMALDSEKE